MTEEFFYQREDELYDWIAQNLVTADPLGTNETDTFTATASQTVFTLTNKAVCYIKSVTVNSVLQKRGWDYTVTYGDVNQDTVVTMNTGVSVGLSVVIVYHITDTFFDREYSRATEIMPRIILIYLTASKQRAGLGDIMTGGVGTFINASYRIEVRSLNAQEARRLASEMFNMADKARHANLYKTVWTLGSDMQQLNFDPDKNAYTFQMTLDVKWQLLVQ